MIKFLLSFTAALLFVPMLAHAHGGVSKNVGSAIVYLNQSPVSPLVGEKVNMNFVFQDNQFNVLTNLDVKLTLTDTFYGDESKDKEILEQNFKTDANGSLDFSYTFEKENFFDVDLDFLDPVTKNLENTGFLVQPRSVGGQTKFLELFIASVIGLVIGIMGAKFIPKMLKKPQNKQNT